MVAGEGSEGRHTGLGTGPAPGPLSGVSIWGHLSAFSCPCDMVAGVCMWGRDRTTEKLDLCL